MGMGAETPETRGHRTLSAWALPHGFSCVNVHSQQHVLVMCATAFYLIENYPLDVGPEFSASVIQVSGLGRLPLEQGAGVRARSPAGGRVKSSFLLRCVG